MADQQMCQRQAQAKRYRDRQQNQQKRIRQHKLEKYRIFQDVGVMLKAYPCAIRIVERPVAEAGIHADRDGHDLEHAQNDDGRRYQLQAETVLLVETATLCGRTNALSRSLERLLDVVG